LIYYATPNRPIPGGVITMDIWWNSAQDKIWKTRFVIHTCWRVCTIQCHATLFIISVGTPRSGMWEKNSPGKNPPFGKVGKNQHLVKGMTTVHLAYIGLDWTSIFCPFYTKSVKWNEMIRYMRGGGDALCVKWTNVRFTCKTDTVRYKHKLNMKRSNLWFTWSHISAWSCIMGVHPTPTSGIKP
jgi:hypothetical protein